MFINYKLDDKVLVKVPLHEALKNLKDMKTYTQYLKCSPKIAFS